MMAMKAYTLPGTATVAAAATSLFARAPRRMRYVRWLAMVTPRSDPREAP
jgi:hypothetical protein